MSKVWGGAGQDIYEESSTRKHPLGRRLQVGDRVFRYAQVTGGVNAGVLISAASPAVDHTGLAVTTAAAGATAVTVTNGATTEVTANMFEDGWLSADTGTGFGVTYRVKSNTAAAVNVAFTLTLYDPLVVALTAATNTVSLLRNQYVACVIHDSPPVAALCGVAPVAVTTNYYCWLQTWGPASVLEDNTTLVVGDGCAASAATDGSVGICSEDTNARVGLVMRPEGSGEKALVYLQIAP